MLNLQILYLSIKVKYLANIAELSFMISVKRIPGKNKHNVQKQNDYTWGERVFVSFKQSQQEKQVSYSQVLCISSPSFLFFGCVNIHTGGMNDSIYYFATTITTASSQLLLLSSSSSALTQSPQTVAEEMIVSLMT